VQRNPATICQKKELMRTNSLGVKRKGKSQRSATLRKSCEEKVEHRNSVAAIHAPVALLEAHFPTIQPETTFLFFNPDAKQVFLAGEFNKWQPNVTAMENTGDGMWRVNVALAPGRYEYRLLVDGIWQEDPMAERFVTNPFGGLNSVAIVAQ
jgi:1,4-alpha-glucan branching enzyme